MDTSIVHKKRKNSFDFICAERCELREMHLNKNTINFIITFGTLFETTSSQPEHFDVASGIHKMRKKERKKQRVCDEMILTILLLRINYLG